MKLKQSGDAKDKVLVNLGFILCKGRSHKDLDDHQFTVIGNSDKI